MDGAIEPRRQVAVNGGNGQHGLAGYNKIFIEPI